MLATVNHRRISLNMMEEELRCPACRNLYNCPVILPCSHSICANCAHNLQASGLASGQRFCDQTQVQSEYADYPESDRLSACETDSGVSFAGYAASQASSSSTGSTVSTASSGISSGGNGHHFPSVDSLRITCPQCHRSIYLDEKGITSFPRNKVVDGIVTRYGQAKSELVNCQLCVGAAAEATSYCEQCDVFYCAACRESCHPSRGPLAKHNLVAPARGKIRTMARKTPTPSNCEDHKEEGLSMYCVLCKMPVCYLCLNEGKHMNHEVKALGAMAKSQKAELSQALTSLTEKARSAKDFMVQLKHAVEHVQSSGIDFEASLVAKFDHLIALLQKRKEVLLQQVQREKEFKTKMIKNHIGQCSSKLRQTTGLLEFSIEVMKEQDAAAFLMVSGALINRVRNSEASWEKEMILEARVAENYELTLDSDMACQSIERLNFKEMKAPEPPMVVPEDCSVENNTVTIAWQTHPTSWVEGYVLELDDGCNGEYREVYCGRETICSVDGLHFDSTYNARVKAYNHAGEGEYSESICLQTAEDIGGTGKVVIKRLARAPSLAPLAPSTVAWFQPDPRTSHPDIVFKNDNMTLTSRSSDDRVVLGNVGFSKGVHYWEITIDRYDNHPDPAFGIARFDTAKDAMLGKDDKSWSMYIDSNRSWFLHGNAHTDRTEGGIGIGCVIGVLLDLNKRTIQYTVNDQRQGPVAFSDLHGVFFPALGINRNVQVTVHPGLDIPTEFDDID